MFYKNKPVHDMTLHDHCIVAAIQGISAAAPIYSANTKANAEAKAQQVLDLVEAVFDKSVTASAATNPVPTK